MAKAKELPRPAELLGGQPCTPPPARKPRRPRRSFAPSSQSSSLARRQRTEEPQLPDVTDRSLGHNEPTAFCPGPACLAEEPLKSFGLANEPRALHLEPGRRREFKEDRPCRIFKFE